MKASVVIVILQMFCLLCIVCSILGWTIDAEMTGKEFLSQLPTKLALLSYGISLILEKIQKHVNNL